jgi:hypothetical protein
VTALELRAAIRAQHETGRDSASNQSNCQRRELMKKKHVNKVQWKFTHITDERTDQAFIGIDFPTRSHGIRFAIFDQEVVEKKKKLRQELNSHGAALSGTIAQQEAFVEALAKKISDKKLQIAAKPGWRHGGFVHGKLMIGATKGHYRWLSDKDDALRAGLGRRRGTIDSWKRDVGRPLTLSTVGSGALMHTLAAPLAGYVAMHMRTAAELGELVSESCIINFSGTSGTGRTTLSRAAAGLFGRPGDIERWQFTRRGLEEAAEARNDLVLILDDTETHVDDTMKLKTALRLVNETIPNGKSKAMAKTAKASGLPALEWFTCGVTSSPEPIDDIAARVGWIRSPGEKVRWPNIDVGGLGEGGIFDNQKGNSEECVSRGKELIEQVRRGTARNYGLVMPLWIEFLLEDNYAGRIHELTDKFVHKVAGHGDGWDQRLARQFGMQYAAGKLAVEAGILPWSPDWPWKAARQCYHNALRCLYRDKAALDKKLALVVAASKDASRVIKVKQGSRILIVLDGNALGISTTFKGRRVCALRDDALIRLAGGRVAARAITARLQQTGALVGGHGHAKTSQLPVRIKVSGKLAKKPRFWVIDADKLETMIMTK